MKKLLDSDWMIAVQFKCNNSAKSATPVQIALRNSGLGRTIRNPGSGKGGGGGGVTKFPKKKFRQGKFFQKNIRANSTPSNRVDLPYWKQILQPTLTEKKIHTLEIFCAPPPPPEISNGPHLMICRKTMRIFLGQ